MSEAYQTKQVILMRTDLRNTQGQKVRSGKLMAQAGHAAMLWLSKRCQEQLREEDEYGRRDLADDVPLPDPFRHQFSDAELTWLQGSFAKIVLAVDSELALTDLVEKAKYLGVTAYYVTDNGTTEFGGVPTVTCAAIGPATSDIIDRITSHLRPL